MEGRKEGRQGGRKGSETITWWTTYISSKYLLKNYSKNKKELLGKITIALKPQSNSICLQTICLLIIQLLLPNMPNHVKCETHKMSSQFIFRVSPWQAVERIIGLSGLATYKARQKCKNLSFKYSTDVTILITCILLFFTLRNGLYFWKLTCLLRFHLVSLDFAADSHHFCPMHSRIQASASSL